MVSARDDCVLAPGQHRTKDAPCRQMSVEGSRAPTLDDLRVFSSGWHRALARARCQPRQRGRWIISPEAAVNSTGDVGNAGNACSNSKGARELSFDDGVSPGQHGKVNLVKSQGTEMATEHSLLVSGL